MVSKPASAITTLGLVIGLPCDNFILNPPITGKYSFESFVFAGAINIDRSYAVEEVKNSYLPNSNQYDDGHSNLKYQLSIFLLSFSNMKFNCVTPKDIVFVRYYFDSKSTIIKAIGDKHEIRKI